MFNEQQSITLDLQQSQKINIGGVVREVATYKDIATICSKDLKTGYGGLDKNQYLAILCNNLGFNKRPESLDWLDQNPENNPIENIAKTVPIDPNLITFVLQQNQSLAIQKDMSLFNLLSCIYYWIRGDLEAGYIIESKKCWQLPPKNEVLYKYKNDIEIKRSYEVRTQKEFWCVSDIFSRRFHNLCKHVNKDYFDNCIRQFEKYTQMIPVKDPVSVFVSAIINPDLLMSIIRECEMKAAEKVNKQVNGYTALRPDFNTAQEFRDLLYEQFDYISHLYREYGAQAFLNLKQKIVPDIQKRITMNSDIVDARKDVLAQFSTVKEKIEYVKALEITPERKAFIFNYVERESIPGQLFGMEIHRDEHGNTKITYNQEYDELLKRLYCLFDISRTINRKEVIDVDSRWIFAKKFYGNANRFALYNRSSQVYLVLNPDITSEIMSKEAIVPYYEEKYGETRFHDPEELGDSLDAKESKSYDLNQQQVVETKSA